MNNNINERNPGAWRTDDRFAFSNNSFDDIVGGSKPFSFVATTILLAIGVLMILLYIGSFLIPTLMLIRSFYMPIFLGVIIPASIIGALALMINGSIILAIVALVVTFIATVVLGVFSGTVGSNEAANYPLKNARHNDVYEWA